jgi:hypothetical protein
VTEKDQYQLKAIEKLIGHPIEVEARPPRRENGPRDHRRSRDDRGPREHREHRPRHHRPHAPRENSTPVVESVKPVEAAVIAQVAKKSLWERMKGWLKLP